MDWTTLKDLAISLWPTVLAVMLGFPVFKHLSNAIKEIAEAAYAVFDLINYIPEVAADNKIDAAEIALFKAKAKKVKEEASHILPALKKIKS